VFGGFCVYWTGTEVLRVWGDLLCPGEEQGYSCTLVLRVWGNYVVYWIGIWVLLCLGIVGLEGICCVMDRSWGIAVPWH
jgi:hypothetical protein